MANVTRSTTTGNQHVDFAAIRANLQSVSPAVAATLRNATPKNGIQPTINEINGTDTINPFKLERLSTIISNNINAVSDLRAITPYIDKAELIWNTVMFFPNGKQDKILTYGTQTTQYKNTQMHAELLKIWENYFTNDYKIERELIPWANDILWNTGSVCLFNLSRAGLDYLINGSTTSPENHKDGTKDSRSGVETFREQARANLAKSFSRQSDGTYLCLNKGRFVRDPHAEKASGNDRVSGLEALLSGQGNYAGLEFNIFNGVKGKDFNSGNKEAHTERELSEMMNITITDNPDILYFQRFKDKVRENDINSIMGIEDLDAIISSIPPPPDPTPKDDEPPLKGGKKPKKRKEDDEQAKTQNLTEEQLINLTHQIFPNRSVRHQVMQHVKTNDSLSVQPYGRGLRWHIPSEAVVPIHYNGRSSDKIDYIFLLDEQGNFLKTSGDDSFYQGGGNSTKQQSVQDRPQQGSTDQLISSLRTVQEGKACDFDMSEFAELAKSTIIKQFVQAIASGTGDQVSITLDEETNKIFLARMFRRQGVRCLYVPGEAVTYMAFKYSRLGTGQSLTQMAKMHIARLAALDFADALANLQGAQPHSLMTITPEQYDGDPHNSAALARAKFFQSNPRLHSLLSSAQLSIPQIADSLRESSLTIKINASDNPNMPAPDIDVQHMDKDHFKPVDDASRQKVLNDVANYFHLPRSWLDVSDDANNFQIEAITEHQMVHNQGANWQAQFCGFIIDHERKHARVNDPLLKSIVTCIRENKKYWVPDNKKAIEGEDGHVIKVILTDFMISLNCSLPDAANTESTEKLKANLEAVTDLVEAWEIMSGNTKVMAQLIKRMGIQAEQFSEEEVKTMIKSVFLTQAFKTYNLPMPFDDIVNGGKGGGIASLVMDIVNQRHNTLEFMMKLFDESFKADEKGKKTYKSIIERINAPAEPEVPEGGELDADGNPIVPGEEGGALPEDGTLPDDDSVPGMPGEGEEEEEEELEEGEKPVDENAPAMPGEGEGDEGGSPSEGSNDPESPEYNPWKSGPKK